MPYWCRYDIYLSDENTLFSTDSNNDLVEQNYASFKKVLILTINFNFILIPFIHAEMRIVIHKILIC